MAVGRVRRFIALAVAGTAMAAAPAMAQTPPSNSTTTTTTPPAGDTTTTTSPATGGDAPPESVPDVPITVPPRESTDAVPPPPGRVVSVDLRAARASALARQAAYADVVARRTQLEQDLTPCKIG